MKYLKPILSLAMSLIIFTTPVSYGEAPLASSTSFTANELEVGGKTEKVTASVKIAKDKLRTFTLTTTQQQRDDKEKNRVITENNLSPQVHSNSLLFDALFSQAMDDMRLASVTAIRDGSYNKGESIPCNCFETGEKWNYVWTRDLAYGANLGLAHLDPQRTVNSMLFKISGFRDGAKVPENIPATSLQIIQDTGSGGSWPVSTDRVTWALAVKNVLQSLTGTERDAFLSKAYAALIGTVEADRAVIFDRHAGLYGGEQSYMDWRTQTYAPWIVNNLSRMADSKALSTNVLHFNALQLAAELAQAKSEKKLAEKYSLWAADLKQKINEKFWLSDIGMYSTMTSAAEDDAPIYKYDMLGNALAILLGVANETQAQKIIATYPNTPMGMPVYYPQQPNIFVYHNRSMWPFVTAYALKAAVKVGNFKVADNAVQSLVRGAALNLSNMENLEWLTGKPYYDDGPEINSRRQLWSIGAYAAMAIETIFGVRLEDNGLTVKPFLTSKTLELLGAGKQASLDNVAFKGHKISVKLTLPAPSVTDGVYNIAAITLNNKPISGTITEAQLTAKDNIINVSFGELSSTAQIMTMAENVDPLSHNDAKVFSPEAPIGVNVQMIKGKYSVDFKDAAHQSPENLTYNIYKNGKLKASHLTEKNWLDNESTSAELRTCFSVESEYKSSGNKSHHSAPKCVDGTAAQIIKVTDKPIVSNVKPLLDAEHYTDAVLPEWGAPNDTFRVNKLTIKSKGTYVIQVFYNNRQATIDTGITNAVKTINLLDEDGKTIQRGVIQMPNIKDVNNRYPFNTSTEFKVDVMKGTYQLVLGDYFNMSYLQANSTYKGVGGLGGAVNKTSIAGVKIVKIN